MLLFKTERLEIREMKESDLELFIELLSDPRVIDPIPQPRWTEEEIRAKFEIFTDYPEAPLTREKITWGVYETGSKELIGFCALLTNDENQREIGYRFRTKYWGKGYGTELTRHMIDHYFNVLGINTLAADVNVENIPSAKILDKFFTPVREFYNKRDQCTDRRYILKKEDWPKRMDSC
ncbi:GNAT family N-acetyltransferase [Robertkochia sediminum]|uniref:GNAT family N-acetyltransferase n=1 Tax=Robertkochia sediminum TaxID=2785326 RepID=UPI00193281B3|nr:GNAT family N-acetyltransferase [Robertkochia sediminum]MBL7473197.1 GNAT family N-acetyltransferase [Robertkochia sediminum]